MKLVSILSLLFLSGNLFATDVTYRVQDFQGATLNAKVAEMLPLNVPSVRGTNVVSTDRRTVVSSTNGLFTFTNVFIPNCYKITFKGPFSDSVITNCFDSDATNSSTINGADYITNQVAVTALTSTRFLLKSNDTSYSQTLTNPALKGTITVNGTNINTLFGSGGGESVSLASRTNSGTVSSNSFLTFDSPSRTLTGSALHPPKGINTYQYYGTGASLTESNVLTQAAYNATNGMLTAGYDTFVIDEGWQERNTTNGLLQFNSKFPSGWTNIATIRAMGYKHVGLYCDWTIAGAADFPGLYTNIWGNATNLAALGVDFIKLDGEGTAPDYNDQRYATELFHKAYLSTGKPYYLEIGSHGFKPWMSGIVNTWRNGGLFGDAANFSSFLNWVKCVNTNRGFATPGHWNNLDGLWQVSGNEDRGRLTMHAMFSAPLTFTAPYNASYVNIYTNREVLNVVDDFTDGQAIQLFTNDVYWVYLKKVDGTSSGRYALGILNVASTNARVSFALTNVMPSFTGNWSIRDLWKQTMCGYSNVVNADILSHSGALFKLFPTVQTQWKAGTNWLATDSMRFASGTNLSGFEPLIGSLVAFPGTPPTIGGTNYTNSVNFYGESENPGATNTYYLGGQATRFTGILGEHDLSSVSNSLEIYGDSTLLFTNFMVGSSTPATNISLDLTGYNYLTFKVRTVSGGGSGWPAIVNGAIYCPTETRSPENPALRSFVLSDTTTTTLYDPTLIITGNPTMQRIITNAGNSIAFDFINDGDNTGFNIAGELKASSFFGSGAGLTSIPISGVTGQSATNNSFTTNLAEITVTNTSFTTNLANLTTNFVPKSGGTMSDRLSITNSTGTNTISSSGIQITQGANVILITNGFRSSGGTITTNDFALLDLSGTWNNSSNTFTGIKLNMTNTSSPSASKLIDLQADGVSRFIVYKSGTIALSNASTLVPATSDRAGFMVTAAGSGSVLGEIQAYNFFAANAQNGNTVRLSPTGVSMATGAGIGYSSSTSYNSPDVGTRRSSSGVMKIDDGNDGAGALRDLLARSSIFSTTVTATNGFYSSDATSGSTTIKGTGTYTNSTGTNIVRPAGISITQGANTVTLTNGIGNFSGSVTGATFTGSGASITSLNGSSVASGTVAAARLGSGIANTQTYLRGDGTWFTNAYNLILPTNMVAFSTDLKDSADSVTLPAGTYKYYGLLTADTVSETAGVTAQLSFSTDCSAGTIGFQEIYTANSTNNTYQTPSLASVVMRHTSGVAAYLVSSYVDAPLNFAMAVAQGTVTFDSASTVKFQVQQRSATDAVNGTTLRSNSFVQFVPLY